MVFLDNTQEIETSPEKSILIMPDGRSANPYQTLLARSIEKTGAIVSFAEGYRRGLPLFREVLAQRPDVLHLHWILPYLKGKSCWIRTVYAAKFLLDVLFVKLTGVRVVWTVHNRITHDTPFPKLEQWVRRNLAKLVDRIILHNRSTLEELAQEYQFPLHKATVIPHGHYREVYSERISSLEARKALNLPTTGTIFLSLGLLRPYKGVETLIETWVNNQAAFSNCTLVIAGKASPTYSETLQSKIAECSNVILIPEFIEDDRIHLFFSAASIAVLPYKQVLNSGSLILAMSYGLPVIAPRLESIAEYLETADCLLFEPNDDQGLFKAMKLSTESNLDELSQTTIAQCNHLDWYKIGQDTHTVYLEAAHS